MPLTLTLTLTLTLLPCPCPCEQCSDCSREIESKDNLCPVCRTPLEMCLEILS